jgi:electron transfer flavoprotein beta subunit
MKIVVAVKQVAALDDEFELTEDGRDVDPDFLEWDLNEWDAFALEAAVEIGEAAESVEIVAMSVGDENAEDGLLTCLAKGADRAVRVWEDGLDGRDVMTVARVLAPAIEREAPDLVLCGAQSSDGVNSATGTAVAALLGLPRVAVVKGIEYDAGAGSLTVERELEGGLVELLRISTPALLTVQTGINRPRYANLRAIKQAKEKPLDQVAPASLGITDEMVAAAAGAKVIGLASPDQGGGAEMIDGDADAVAERIATIIKEKVGVGA